jgi:hypothetical protein
MADATRQLIVNLIHLAASSLQPNPLLPDIISVLETALSLQNLILTLQQAAESAQQAATSISIKVAYLQSTGLHMQEEAACIEQSITSLKRTAGVLQRSTTYFRHAQYSLEKGVPSKPSLEGSPHEIIVLIFKDLDINGRAFLGLTCPKLYAILKRDFYPGPIPLNERGFWRHDIQIKLGQAIRSWKGLKLYRLCI